MPENVNVVEKVRRLIASRETSIRILEAELEAYANVDAKAFADVIKVKEARLKKLYVELNGFKEVVTQLELKLPR